MLPRELSKLPFGYGDHKGDGERERKEDGQKAAFDHEILANRIRVFHGLMFMFPTTNDEMQNGPHVESLVMALIQR